MRDSTIELRNSVMRHRRRTRLVLTTLAFGAAVAAALVFRPVLAHSQVVPSSASCGLAPWELPAAN
jgi:hypothetical protein